MIKYEILKIRLLEPGAFEPEPWLIPPLVLTFATFPDGEPGSELDDLGRALAALPHEGQDRRKDEEAGRGIAGQLFPPVYPLLQL